jgi:anti-sigma factor RsiW
MGTGESELSCRELVELVTDYLEGALAARERARFEEHLVYCPGCAYHLAQVRDTIRVAGSLREEHLSEEARSALLGAFRDWHRTEGGVA